MGPLSPGVIFGMDCTTNTIWGFFFFVRLVYTYEAGGVVVTDCLGVSVGLKYGVSLHDLVLQASLFSFGFRSSGKGSGKRDGAKREVGICFCMRRGKVG